MNERTVAIMQPYFFPYIGYFQLIHAADVFVVYDNIQYTKKGWINRNRILVNDKDEYISLPLTKSSDYIEVREKELSADYEKQAIKLLRKIEGAYRKAPYFKVVYPLLEEIIYHKQRNLYDFLYNSIKEIVNYLNIETEIVVSSDIPIDHSLKAQDKVLDIVKTLRGTVYINPVGGIGLYDKDVFKHNGIDLVFHKARIISYPQFNNEHLPFLSIIDVLMFNSLNQIQVFLNEYDRF